MDRPPTLELDVGSDNGLPSPVGGWETSDQLLSDDDLASPATPGTFLTGLDASAVLPTDGDSTDDGTPFSSPATPGAFLAGFRGEVAERPAECAAAAGTSTLQRHDAAVVRAAGGDEVGRFGEAALARFLTLLPEPPLSKVGSEPKWIAQWVLDRLEPGRDLVHHLVRQSGLLQCNVKNLSEAHSASLQQLEEAAGGQDERQYELGELRGEIRTIEVKMRKVEHAHRGPAAAARPCCRWNRRVMRSL